VLRWNLLFVLLSLSAEGLSGQAGPTRPHRATLRLQLDSIVEASLSDLPLAGVSVAVMQGDDTLAWTARGYADLENRVPATPSTVYRIGSIAKQLTAAAILQQVERGAIDLDDDVAKYVPEYSRRRKHVTIRQLLNHTSGIKDLNDLGDRFSRTLAVDLPQKDILALIRDQPFGFQPGTKWSYANTGYYLLGVILERVTGMAYADYIKQRVAGPAGLAATTYCDTRSLITHRARGYDAVGVAFLNATHMSMTNPFSAAGLCSTLGDLTTWARALRSGKVISRQSYEVMTTPVGAAARASPPYGFGVWVIQSRGRRYITHHGLMAGFNAVLSEVPSDSLTIAVLTNTSGLGASILGGRLGSVILGIPAPSVEKATRLAQPQGRPLTASDRRRYIGRYGLREVRENSSAVTGVITLEIFDENGRLTAHLTGDPPEVLVPAGEHQFVAAARPDLHWAFEVHGGHARAVTFVSPDGRYKGGRISETEP
jgi:D-alanyl-D-alanine carboxypeptidase